MSIDLIVKKLREKFPWKWRQLRTVGSDKVLTSTLIFLFLVPTLASLLREVNNPLIIPFANKTELKLNLTLPFSLYLAYFAALCTFLGNLLYQLRCPHTIKYYRTFQDFNNEGQHLHSLIEPLNELLPGELRIVPAILYQEGQSSRNRKFSTQLQEANKYFLEKYPGLAKSHKRGFFHGPFANPMHQQFMNQYPLTFAYILEILDHAKLLERKVISGLYTLAGLSLLCIFIQNIGAVIQLLIK